MEGDRSSKKNKKIIIDTHGKKDNSNNVMVRGMKQWREMTVKQLKK